VQVIADKFHKKLAEDPIFDVVEIPGHIILKIKKEAQHYWSPQLNLALEEVDDGTLIRGRYEPHHNVWTLFILIYLALSILALFVFIFGASQWGLGLPAKILWLIPVLLAMAAGLYFVSQIGQKLGAEETFALHHFVEENLGVKIHIK
jgi:hypothetical protein